MALTDLWSFVIPSTSFRWPHVSFQLLRVQHGDSLAREYSRIRRGIDYSFMRFWPSRRLNDHIGHVTHSFLDQGDYTAASNSWVRLDMILLGLHISISSLALFVIQCLRRRVVSERRDTLDYFSKSDFQRIEDPNILSFLHVTLVFRHHSLRSLAIARLIWSEILPVPWKMTSGPGPRNSPWEDLDNTLG
jgi:hypothetical protein